MTLDDYEALSWPSRVKYARMALPKSTKQYLADFLCVSIHTIINWETGRRVPQRQYRDLLKELCLKGMTPSSAGIGIDFLLGGFDANEKHLCKPLVLRDKAGTTIALMSIAVHVATYIYAAISKKILVTTINTVFNTYPSVVDIVVCPVEYPDIKYIIKLSHLLAGTAYTIELLGVQNDSVTNRFICNVSDKGISTVIRLLKKSIKLLK